MPSVEVTCYHPIPRNNVEDHIVSIMFEERSKDGRALSHPFYATDMEEALIFLYGDDPVERQTNLVFFVRTQ